MVMYYRDGSGYPGSPPTLEVTGYDCTLIDTGIGKVSPTPDQRLALNRWMADYVGNHPNVLESIESAIADQLERMSEYDGEYDDIDD